MHIFYELDKQTRILESDDNINCYGRDIVQYVRVNLKEITNLLRNFADLISAKTDERDAITRLYKEGMDMYSLMSLSQLSKDSLNKVHVNKTDAPRNQKTTE